MNVEKIDNLEEVLVLDPDTTILSHTVKRLTAAGENYGSLMLSVDVVVQTPGKTEEIHTVAKMVPPNEFVQKFFGTKVTFKNEINFYSIIAPTLREFQKEQGLENTINFLPKYYGSRLNQNGSLEVDANAVLFLENLKYKGYSIFDRMEGFDLESAKVIIQDFAEFHAVPVALKLKKPEVFQEKIKANLAPFKLEGYRPFIAKFIKLIDNIDELKVYRTRVKKALEDFSKGTIREPWATLSHNDGWVNNFMLKVDNGKVNNKLVDFQLYDYGSPAKDTLFFLFSSVKNPILEENYDVLVRLYHERFLSVLEELKCDTTRFSFEELLKELDFEAKSSQYVHLIFMTFPIFRQEDTAKDVGELTPDNFLNIEAVLSDVQKEKIIFIVREFVKRNWI